MERGKGLLAAAALLVLPAPASAQGATLYASQGGANANGCPQATPCSLPNAITEASGPDFPGHDAIQVVGALTHDGTVALEPAAATPGIDLVGNGQGSGGTLIRPTANHSSAVTVGATSSLRNLRVISAHDETVVAGDQVVTLHSGGDATDVTSGTEHNEDDGFSIAAGPGETVLERVTAASGLFQGVGTGSGSLLVRDSLLNGQTAFLHVVGGTANIQRTTLRGQIGVSHSGGALTVSSSLIEASSTGAYFSGGALPGLLRNVTVAGQAGMQGVWASSNSDVTVTGSIVRGFTNDLAETSSAVLRVGTSDFATALGAVQDLGGNVNVDPRWVDPAAGDFRLQPQSQLIDAAGGEGIATGESPFDRIGSARLLDGNGDGSALRDMGAFEYRAAAAAIDVSNPSPVQGEAVVFDASRSIYAEAAIGDHQWDLDGDGVFETIGQGPRVSRAYSAAGPVTVRLRVLGADGGAAGASILVNVRDVVQPGLDRASLTRSAFAVGAAPTVLVSSMGRRRVARGTVIRYRLSETSTVRIVISQARPGRRVGRRCLAPTRARRRRPRCTRWVLRGTLVRRNLAAGNRRTTFTGRLGRRRLAPGRHRAQLRATDLAGNRSPIRTLPFRVLRG